MGKKNEAARMLANLNGPWSNAACMSYCLIAMRRANLRPGAQRRVLMVLEQCFDDVSAGRRADRLCKVGGREHLRRVGDSAGSDRRRRTLPDL